MSLTICISVSCLQDIFSCTELRKTIFVISNQKPCVLHILTFNQNITLWQTHTNNDGQSIINILATGLFLLIINKILEVVLSTFAFPEEHHLYGCDSVQAVTRCPRGPGCGEAPQWRHLRIKPRLTIRMLPVRQEGVRMQDVRMAHSAASGWPGYKPRVQRVVAAVHVPSSFSLYLCVWQWLPSSAVSTAADKTRDG